MKKIHFLTIISLLSSSFLFGQGQATVLLSPQEALNRLLKGNTRYTNDALEHPSRDQMRRQAVAASQSPFAIIVGCADSRVPPEVVFDQGLGDLFVVRVAGNVIGPLELDSIDYAALYLRSVIILVMGHENCGAVNAVVSNHTQDIESVAKLIQPSVQEAKKNSKKNILEASIKANACRMRNFLIQSPVIQRLVSEKKIEVHAAYYNLQTGAVEILKS